MLALLTTNFAVYHHYCYCDNACMCCAVTCIKHAKHSLLLLLYTLTDCYFWYMYIAIVTIVYLLKFVVVFVCVCVLVTGL